LLCSFSLKRSAGEAKRGEEGRSKDPSVKEGVGEGAGVVVCVGVVRCRSMIRCCSRLRGG